MCFVISLLYSYALTWRIKDDDDDDDHDRCVQADCQPALKASV